MASSPRPDPAEMSLDSLITPPHHTFNSFSKSSMLDGGPSPGPITGSGGASVKNPAPLPPPLMSPPVSPYVQLASPDHHNINVSSDELVQDPVLFPADEASSPAFHAQDPLFSHGAPQVAASESTRSASSKKRRPVAPPGPFVTLHMGIMPAYLKNPKNWRLRELAWLKKEEQARLRERQKKEGAALEEEPELAETIMAAEKGKGKGKERAKAKGKGKAAAKVSKPAKTVDPRPIPSIAPKPPASGGAGPSGRPIRARRATATAAAAAEAAALSLAGLANHGSGTVPLTMVARAPEPIRKRTVAPKTENKDVKNFAILPDYCPPLDSLDGQAKILRVEWKCNAIDLTNDIHRHLLHPDELSLASGLRLDCAHYLAVKRRFFVDRLKCLKDGKQFRKTDAQKACGIDVNKASQLWTAYDRVGWLKPQWMDPFL